MALIDIFRFGKKDIYKTKDEYNSDKEKVILKDLSDPDMEDIDLIGGGINSYSINMLPTENTIKGKILAYRRASVSPEIDQAINEIVSDAIVNDDDSIVKLNLDKIDISDNIKDKIFEEFKNIIKKLKFNKYASDYFKRWYVDGRIYFLVVPDKREMNGIKLVRELRSTHIFRVKLDGKVYYKYNFDIEKYRAFSFYNNKYRNKGYIFIPEEYIVSVYSGVLDVSQNFHVSHIEKAIKPLNQLNLLENAAVVYRVSRAPERRVFYISVGKMPKKKAEDYVRKLMEKFRSKLTYDVVSGDVQKQNSAMSMVEDFYLPTNSDGTKGTKVDTLTGGNQLGEITDILYFKQKLYKSLKVPISRIDEESGNFAFGKSIDLTRDELRFAKEVKKLRHNFGFLLIDILIKQLLYKNIISYREVEIYESDIQLIWSSDTYLDQLRETEVLQSQLDLADSFTSYVGKYFSHNYIRKHVFYQTDEEIAENDEEIAKEKQKPQFKSEEGF